MSKIIKFTYPRGFTEYLKDVLPVPIKTNIPEWFKKLEHKHSHQTVKGCIPFLDTLTAGYLIKCPQDIYINFNIDNPETKEKDTYFQTAVDNPNVTQYLNINTSEIQSHSTKQLEGSPLISKNKNCPFFKILNPFKIITPPGYSILIVPPLNNSDDRFEIIPGIVDTDTYKTEINFPIVLNGDKYDTLETVIDRGAPLAQIIPFKRDDWKMEVKEEEKKIPYSLVNIQRLILHNYKKIWWTKKKWN